MPLQAHADENVMPAQLAGSWYPGDAKALGAMLEGLSKGITVTIPSGGTIGVIISPHAGYRYAAATAVRGFYAVSRQKIATVIVLAPSHHYSFAGASVWPDGFFETPLGALEVDKDLAARITAFDKRFVFRRDVFQGIPGRPENSVETQLPFIKKFLPGAKVVPVVVGFPPDADMLKTIAAALVSAVGDRTDVLVDVSVDQSHFHPLAQAREIDERGLKAIEAMDIEGLWKGHAGGQMEVDGFHVVTAAMFYARARGFDNVKVLGYATSAGSTGDSSSVVGYASVMFYRGTRKQAASAESSGIPLNAAQKARLLAIARETLETFVRTGKAPVYNESDPRLSAEEGAFVTLNKNGRLRGCIGNISGQGPLYGTIRNMAVAAASEDPRFDPVRPAELAEISVEVSVLSRPHPVRSVDEIVLGRDGVIVGKGFHHGVFLPQVAMETGWSKDRFLSELCSQKAGLPADCWKDPAAGIEVFTADVFKENSK